MPRPAPSPEVYRLTQAALPDAVPPAIRLRRLLKLLLRAYGMRALRVEDLTQATAVAALERPELHRG